MQQEQKGFGGGETSADQPNTNQPNPSSEGRENRKEYENQSGKINPEKNSDRSESQQNERTREDEGKLRGELENKPRPQDYSDEDESNEEGI